MLRKGVANQGKRLTQIRRQSANVGASVAVKVNSLAFEFFSGNVIKLFKSLV